MELYFLPASAVPAAVPTQKVETRRSANYHPSLWGDHFLNYASHLPEINGNAEQHQKLKDQVQKMLVATTSDHEQLMNLIDAIQRLGVSYHFETEIDTALRDIFDDTFHENINHDLYTAALRFRLLRQQGHNVSCGMFKRFMDEAGKFKEFLITDVHGLLSLYEATHLRVHGEDILDKALAFTTVHLESSLPNLSHPLAAQVSHALQIPIRKGLTRLESRFYMSIYQVENSHNKVLLHFAKLDFNMLQKVHQRELSGITRWWKELNVPKNLPFARDRLVECYFWVLGVYFEPQYLLSRRILTKVIAITSIVDDIYDVYGSFEELVLFTDAIERWDISYIDKLPTYMRICYQALLDVYSEMEEEMAKAGKPFAIHYTKKAMKRLIKAYFEEAKWLSEGYTPTMEEYMEVALVTCGYMLLATTSFIGMGELGITKEALDWVSSDPSIVRASSVICRLMDDIVGHKQKSEQMTAVECYMKQHSASTQETYSKFYKQVTDAWKDINKECLHPTSVPMPLLIRVLNLARAINLFYKDEDWYKNSKTQLKNYITSLLIDYVPE